MPTSATWHRPQEGLCFRDCFFPVSRRRGPFLICSVVSWAPTIFALGRCLGELWSKFPDDSLDSAGLGVCRCSGCRPVAMVAVCSWAVTPSAGPDLDGHLGGSRSGQRTLLRNDLIYCIDIFSASVERRWVHYLGYRLGSDGQHCGHWWHGMYGCIYLICSLGKFAIDVILQSELDLKQTLGEVYRQRILQFCNT